MRQLSAALEAAQKQETSTPCIKVRVVNKSGGAVRHKWSRLYSGAEIENYHALAMPADGSLIRVRLTPPSDSRRLYRQRVIDCGR